MAVKVRVGKEWDAWLPANWVFIKYCNCGGVSKYKYRWAGKYELHVMDKKGTFRAFTFNGVPAPMGMIKDMKDKILDLK